MSKITFPNQDQVTIHKERYDGNFLQVSIDEWTTAFATLKPVPLDSIFTCAATWMASIWRSVLLPCSVRLAILTAPTDAPKRNLLKKAT